MALAFINCVRTKDMVCQLQTEIVTVFASHTLLFKPVAATSWLENYLRMIDIYENDKGQIEQRKLVWHKDLQCEAQLSQPQSRKQTDPEESGQQAGVGAIITDGHFMPLSSVLPWI